MRRDERDEKEMNIIETIDLTKEFNGLTAVDGINFSVKKGEIFGFLGPNGAGKTTTINMLITLLLPTKGTAIVNGFDIIESPDDVRRSIGIVPQDVVLESELSARENLEFHAALYEVSKEEMEKRIPVLLDLIELRGREDSKVKTFSGGMKRRLEVVKAFLHRPDIIFMDEPTQGLDPQSRRVVWDHISRLNKEEGVTIFLTTHYMEEADYLCDRIGIIDYGKILDLDSPSNLKDKIGKGELLDIRVSDKADEFLDYMRGKCEFEVKTKDGNFLQIHTPKEEVILPKIVRSAEKLGITIESLSVRKPTLEDVFIHYTGREIREEHAKNATKEFVRRMFK